jgi:HK97 family phage portal protein
VTFDYSPPEPSVFTRIVPSAWSGWPEDWYTPAWSHRNRLVNTAWICVNVNANALSTMPPYLVNASPSLNADWLRNPNPDLYFSWEEFAKQLFWGFQAVGEVFVLATAYYATGWPSRFHVVPPWAVNVELDRDGLRRYTIGSLDVTGEILHLRYQSSVDDAHGHGPLEAMGARLVAAEMLGRYATTIAANGLIPSSILEAPVDTSPEQAATIRDDWVAQRSANPGLPAVLTGGMKWTPTQLNTEQMALLDLQKFNEAQIAVALGVQPVQVALPSGGDPMTYSNVNSLFDYHWRSGLRPLAQTVMAGLSEWNGIVDPVTGQPALTVAEIRASERFDNSSPADLASGVLK